jgi:hypothetical protein
LRHERTDACRRLVLHAGMVSNPYTSDASAPAQPERGGFFAEAEMEDVARSWYV